MKKIPFRTRKIYDGFADELDKIKIDRLKLGIDKKKMVADPRLTKAILHDPLCRENWDRIKSRLSIIPKEEDIR